MVHPPTLAPSTILCIRGGKARHLSALAGSRTHEAAAFTGESSGPKSPPVGVIDESPDNKARKKKFFHLFLAGPPGRPKPQFLRKALKSAKKNTQTEVVSHVLFLDPISRDGFPPLLSTFFTFLPYSALTTSTLPQKGHLCLVSPLEGHQ